MEAFEINHDHSNSSSFSNSTLGAGIKTVEPVLKTVEPVLTFFEKVSIKLDKTAGNFEVTTEVFFSFSTYIFLVINHQSIISNIV